MVEEEPLLEWFLLKPTGALRAIERQHRLDAGRAENCWKGEIPCSRSEKWTRSSPGILIAAGLAGLR